jgi:hypothetical protein
MRHGPWGMYIYFDIIFNINFNKVKQGYLLNQKRIFITLDYVYDAYIQLRNSHLRLSP